MNGLLSLSVVDEFRQDDRVDSSIVKVALLLGVDTVVVEVYDRSHLFGASGVHA